MTKYILSVISIICWLSVFGQSDVTVISESDRAIELSYRKSMRPKAIDTVITTNETVYPLIALQEETHLEIENIKPANVRVKPQLSQLYRGYAKLGMGSRLQPLGEVYYNSVRSRKSNWGVHALHHSEWGKIKDYAPSQYDNTFAKVFGQINESRFSYGGALNYSNKGFNYYGFRDSNANKDSIRQRYQSIGFNAFFDSHVKDTLGLRYRFGVEFENFLSKKPAEEDFKKWRARENFGALRTLWQYNSNVNILLTNIRADLDFVYNDYRYGMEEDTLNSLLDTGIVSKDFIIFFRPQTSFYSKNKKFHFKIGGELALDFGTKFGASLYPLAEVRYSLFNDMFVPYVGATGGLDQQRLKGMTKINEFVNPNQKFENQRRYGVYGGIKGSFTSRISFNASANFSWLKNALLFVNDTVYSSGNKFRAIYDTLSKTTISASLSYQHDEKLKIDLIGKWNKYLTKDNPMAWNLPEWEVGVRGTYNVAHKLIVRLDLGLEFNRFAKVYDETIDEVKEEDGIYYTKLGILPDLNLNVEYRFSKRLSVFVDLNNIVAQQYLRWYNYPVNGFQVMGGLTFRF